MILNTVIESYLKENSFDFNSINGKFNLKFELGQGFENGTKDRVNQATERAFEIFKFIFKEDELCIIEIDEYDNCFFDKQNLFKNYLHEIIQVIKFKRYNGPFDLIIYEKNENGKLNVKVDDDKLDFELILGQIIIDYSSIKKVINGIVNLEMGFEPIICQDVYFYSIKNQIGFRVYDDRGCDVWSNDKENLKPIMLKFKNWLISQ
jgi:hypothetical protein